MELSNLNGMASVKISLDDLGNMAKYDPETNSIEFSLSAWNDLNNDVEKQTWFAQDFDNRLEDDPEILEKWPELANKEYADRVIDKYADLRTDANCSWDVCLDEAIDYVTSQIKDERKEKASIERD